MKIVAIAALTAALFTGTAGFAMAQDTDICTQITQDVSTAAEQLAAVQAATEATVIELEGCQGSLPADLSEALTANEAIARVLQQETVGAGEIIGLGIEDGAITVYVSGDDSE